MNDCENDRAFLFGIVIVFSMVLGILAYFCGEEFMKQYGCRCIIFILICLILCCVFICGIFLASKLVCKEKNDCNQISWQTIDDLKLNKNTCFFLNEASENNISENCTDIVVLTNLISLKASSKIEKGANIYITQPDTIFETNTETFKKIIKNELKFILLNNSSIQFKLSSEEKK